MANKTIRRSDQIVIDTSLAYDAALARGASPEAALDAAVAVYQQAYPRVGKSVSRHLAAVIAGHKLAKQDTLAERMRVRRGTARAEQPAMRQTDLGSGLTTLMRCSPPGPYPFWQVRGESWNR